MLIIKVQKAKREGGKITSSTKGLTNKKSGGVRPPSRPRHDITAPEEPFAFADLSAYLYFFIMNF